MYRNTKCVPGTHLTVTYQQLRAEGKAYNQVEESIRAQEEKLATIRSREARRSRKGQATTGTSSRAAEIEASIASLRAQRDSIKASVGDEYYGAALSSRPRDYNTQRSRKNTIYVRSDSGRITGVITGRQQLQQERASASQKYFAGRDPAGARFLSKGQIQGFSTSQTLGVTVQRPDYARRNDRAQERRASVQAGIYATSNGYVISQLSPGTFKNQKGQVVSVKEPIGQNTTGKFVYPKESQARTITGFNLFDANTRDVLRASAESGNFATAGALYSRAEKQGGLGYLDTIKPGATVQVGPPKGYRRQYVTNLGGGEYRSYGVKETALAPIFRRIGSGTEWASNKLYGSPYLSNTGKWFASEGVSLGKFMQRRPDDFAGSLVIAGGGGYLGGRGAGAVVETVRATRGARAAVATTRAIQYGGAGFAIADLATTKKGEFGVKLSQYAAGGLGFSKGYGFETTLRVSPLGKQTQGTGGYVKRSGDFIEGMGRSQQQVLVQQGRFAQKATFDTATILSGSRPTFEGGKKGPFDITIEQQGVMKAFSRTVNSDQTIRAVGVPRGKGFLLAGLTDKNQAFFARTRTKGVVFDEGVGTPAYLLRGDSVLLSKGKGGFFSVGQVGRSRGVSMPFSSTPTRLSYGIDLDAAFGAKKPRDFLRPSGVRSRGFEEVYATQDVLSRTRPRGGANTELFSQGFRLLEQRGLYSDPVLRQRAPRGVISTRWSGRKGQFSLTRPEQVFDVRTPRRPRAYPESKGYPLLNFPSITPASVSGSKLFGSLRVGIGQSQGSRVGFANSVASRQTPGLGEMSLSKFRFDTGMDVGTIPAVTTSTSTKRVPSLVTTPFTGTPSIGIPKVPAVIEPPVFPGGGFPGFPILLPPGRGADGFGSLGRGFKYNFDLKSAFGGIMSSRAPKGALGGFETRPILGMPRKRRKRKK